MISQIELFPNEIFIEIFEYLDAKDLFQSFYNLNSRFNQLIYSVNNLSLTTDDNELNNIQLFSSHVSTLIINPNINLNLNRFTNIRRLTILYITDETLIQFENYNILTLLEHFVVVHRIEQTTVTNLYRRVFSNGFPNLISCCLLSSGTVRTTDGWTQSPSLHILKLRYVNLSIYQAILSSCPNLQFFRIHMSIINITSVHISSHMNLKKLVLNIPRHISPAADDIISNILSTTPNLEELWLYKYIEESNIISSYLDYDWYRMIINFHLPLLRRFTLYIYISSIDLKILNRIEEHIKKVHNNRYEFRLIMSQLSIFF